MLFASLGENKKAPCNQKLLLRRWFQIERAQGIRQHEIVDVAFHAEERDDLEERGEKRRRKETEIRWKRFEEIRKVVERDSDGQDWPYS